MTTSDTLDYSPLSAPLDAEQQRLIRKATLSKFTAGMILIMGLILIMGFMVVSFQNAAQLVLLLFPAAIIGTIFYLFYRQQYVKETESARLQRLADVNGLTVYRNINDPGYAGMMFSVGKSRQIAHSIELPIGDQQAAEIGRYQYVVRQGKNTTTMEIGFIRMKLPRRLPHMVLDAKSNNFLGKYLSNLPQVFDSSQTFSLEGDFDKYFTLYAPKQYERDALYVFTPDVMAALLDSARSYDIEIVDDELYLYSLMPFKLSDEAELRKLLELCRIIQPELDQQTDYYSDERVGDRQANLIAPEGKRLRRGVNWIVLGGTLVYFGFFFFSNIWTFTGNNPLVVFGMQFVLGTLFILSIAVLIFNWYRKNRPSA